MRKMVTMLLSLMLAATFSISAFAAEPQSLEIQEIDPNSIEELQVIYVGEEITPRGRVEVYTFAIPGDGNYYEIPDFRGEYSKGTTFTVEGTWDPSYAALTVMFRDVVKGGAVEAPNMACNERHTFTLWNSSDWALFVRANGQSLVGTIRIEAS